MNLRKKSKILLNNNKNNSLIVSLYIPLRTDKSLSTILNSLISTYNNSNNHKQLKKDTDEIKDLKKFLEVVKNKAAGYQRSENGKTYVIFADKNGVIDEFAVASKIEPTLVIDKTVFLGPLADQLKKNHRYLLLLMERERAKIYDYNFGDPLLIKETKGEVPKEVRRGSGNWMGFRSDPNEFRIDRHIRWHLKQFFESVSKMVFSVFEKGLDYKNYQGIILGTHRELETPILDSFHPYIKEKIIGDISIDIDENIESIVNKTNSLIKEHEIKEEKKIYQSLDNQKNGGLAVLGQKEVLKQLELGAVSELILIYQPNGISLQDYNRMIKKALELDADIKIIKHTADNFPDKVAALLRYRT